MSRVSDFQPNWASAPGDTIAGILKDQGLSLQLFAKRMDSSIEYVKDLISGYIAITESLADKLEKVTGASAEFWLRREEKYRESLRRIGHTMESKWLEELPIDDMVRLGWLKKTGNIIYDCLSYFDVPDVWTWKRKYNDVIALTAFRKSKKLKANPASVATWLRQGEIQSSLIKCQSWNRDTFRKALERIKPLTKKKRPQEFLPMLQAICAQSGVAVAVVPTPKGCSASGATKFISHDKAMILLSFRYLSDDHFWFTFFHEAAHLFLHEDIGLILEEEGEEQQSVREEEANKFAEETLIPAALRQRLFTMKIEKREIINLAKEAEVSLGIIIGQLQHIGRVDFKHLNSFKRSYDWNDILSN